MKYKHVFWLGLPFTVLGIGKAIHKFRLHHGHCCGESRKNHILTFLSWRLGMSAEQKSNLHTLIQQTHKALEGLKAKKQQVHESIVKSFTQENLDVSALQGSFDSKDCELVKSQLSNALVQFHKILTPLQREKVKEMLQRHHRHFHHCC